VATRSVTKGAFTLTAHRGDAKTLLAFSLDKTATRRLAGFTIQCEPDGRKPHFLLNMLQFERPADHAQDPTLPANSSFNAPFHKFRWLHVPGSAHQGTKPVFGKYTYTVTPRYFDDKQSLLPLDAKLSASVVIDVVPFEKKGLALGFTRGFVQSQAFVRHFGPKAIIKPAKAELMFDTSVKAGVSPEGKPYTFAEEYEWLGYTARDRIFEILDEVLAKTSLRLDVFAYDLNEPDVIARLLKIAKQGRLRIILDNAPLHKSTKTKKSPEDQFEALFPKPKKNERANILRKHFGRFAHDKIFIVSRGKTAVKVLTGSTNLAVTGVYVNSNHVLVYDDAKVAAKYGEVFETVWQQEASAAKFIGTDLSKKPTSFNGVPATDVNFSPHDKTRATAVLDEIVARVKQEAKRPKSDGSVLFAVMEMGEKSTGPVFPALRDLHADQTIFSYGISDNPGGIVLYKPGTKRGILVTGKPGKTQLPPPFNQVPGVGLGHQIHHKFVVCGFNGPDPVVYCGSSNLALGGEQQNGDNLLAISDGDVATVFAIEAVALVDHFHFLNAVAAKGGKAVKKKPPASKSLAAVEAGFFLSTTDKWVEPYFDPADIRSADRKLFI
jgi:PLD-like domain